MTRAKRGDDRGVEVANGIEKVRRTHTRGSVCARAQAQKALRDAVARAEEDEVVDEYLRENGQLDPAE